ncbi:MAG: hypothetical protein ACR2M6_00190 [Vampirovibrionia bacterium]|jgi:hypothetical protein
MLNEIQDYILEIPVPETQEASLTHFRTMYEMVDIKEWIDSDLVFDVGNFILHKRPDLLCIAIRLNVQVNLFLRTLNKYCYDSDDVLGSVGYKIGCFALTEEKAGVLSGLQINTEFEELPDGSYILNSCDSSKNWISQGLFAEFCILFAKNKHDKLDTRIFIIDNQNENIQKESITMLDVNKGLDMAKLTFENLYVPPQSLLELSLGSKKMELLNGIFYGRYMIAEATVSGMIGYMETIERNIWPQYKKFSELGFSQYLKQCKDAYENYKKHLRQQRNLILSRNDLFSVNCYKIYTVEKSLHTFVELSVLFGMKAATSKFSYNNLLLHKVAEGDTFVLRASLINNHIKGGIKEMATKPGLSWTDLYKLSKMNNKKEKYSYVMNNLIRISDSIIEGHIPQIEC